jgi:hypothetical protein
MKKNLLSWLSLAAVVGGLAGAGFVWFWGQIHDALPPGRVRDALEGMLSLVEHLAERTAELLLGGLQSHESPHFLVYLLLFSGLVGAAVALILVLGFAFLRDLFVRH